MMKQVLAVLFSFALFTMAHAQQPVSGPKQNQVLYYPHDANPTSSLSGVASKQVYAKGKSTGSIYDLGVVVDYIKTGEWTYYYRSGKVQEEGEYNNNHKTGKWKIYFENGNVAEEGSYEMGERVSVWKGYYEDGSKRYQVDYNKGEASYYYPKSGKIAEMLSFRFSGDKLYLGNFAAFYENGNKWVEGAFDGNDAGTETESDRLFFSLPYLYKLTGIWKIYWENGNPATEYDFAIGKAKVLSSVPDTTRYTDGTYSLGQKALKGITTSYEKGSGSLLAVQVMKLKKAPRYQTIPKRAMLNDIPLSVTAEATSRVGIWETYSVNRVLKSKIAYDWYSETMHGETINYYNTDKIKSKGKYEYGVTTGKWEYYHENGTLAEERTYTGGQMHGLNIDYFTNGKMKDKAAYADGKLVGVRELYHPNGRLLGKENYNAGKLVSYGDFYDENGNLIYQSGKGYRIEYFDNGKISYKGNYLNEKAEGAATFYYDNGNLHEESYFNNGVRNGAYKSYFESGAVMEKGSYSGGNINGVVEYYHPNGKLLGKSKFVNGNLSSPEDFFDENGNPILSNGTGTFLNYYTNGKVSSRITYLNYCRDGLAEWFYDNGQPDQSALYKYSETQKPTGLRWKVISSYTRAGAKRDPGTLDNGYGTWISYDENGKATTTQYKNGVKSN